jgi:hypothetical protein
MKIGRTKLPPEKRRITYAVTVLPEHIIFLKKHNIISPQVWSDMGEEMRRLEKLDKNLNYRWHVEGLSQGTFDDRGKDECV